jgi:alanyl-tRNA synthetase/misacylated tRNA(Ala) deacylase
MNIFYEQKYLKNASTKFVSSYQSDGKNCLILEDNLFYPHGGGQKGDKGSVVINGNTHNVINTVKSKNPDDGEVIIITDSLVTETTSKGEEAICQLDWEFRYKQMKLHTCVHLHHCMIESAAGKKVHNPDVSTIEDGFALNRYVTGSIDDSFLDEANFKFLEVIKTHTQVITYPDKEKQGLRWWECLGYKIPCGGIHVDYLDEIAQVSISVNNKKGYHTVKISLQ